MTRRCVIGARNNNQFGLYLSRPGVDVFSAADDDLLISPNVRNMAFIVNGTIRLTAGASSNVLYGAGNDVPDAPIVYAQCSRRGESLVPSYQTFPKSLLDGIPLSSNTLPPRWRVDPRSNSVNFRNLKDYANTIRFLILAEAQR